MAKSLTFKEDISFYKGQLEEARAELARLEKELEEHDVKTEDCRKSLRLLKDFLAGKSVNVASKGGKGSKKKIGALQVNPDTNRPGRGKRRQQLLDICRKLGRGKNTFRTIDVLNELEQVESDVSKGMRSYTYAALANFESDGVLEKVGRGTWKLK